MRPVVWGTPGRQAGGHDGETCCLRVSLLHRDKSNNLQQALANHQMRFMDVLEPESPEQLSPRRVLYRLGHEVRSMHHPRFMRPLYNRGQ